MHDALIQTLRRLTLLYPNHIWKEDYLLFPMTNKVLSPEDQAALYERFEAVDDALGRDMHLQFEQLVAGLERRLSDIRVLRQRRWDWSPGRVLQPG